MARDIRVPEISEGITSGTVISISVAVGDTVEAEQPLLEMETDKAVVEIPSPTGGRIAEIRVSEGEDVEIGSVIMTLEPASSGEEKEPKRAPKAERETEEKAKEKPRKVGEKVETEEAKEEVREEPEERPVVDLRSVRRGDAVAPAAPSVRRLARELGVDIYQVQGRGPGGRISETDVRNFVRETMQRITGGGPAPTVHGEFAGLHAQRPLPDFGKWGGISREPLSRIRKVTADAMAYAWSTVPMVTQYDHAQIGRIEEFRSEFNRDRGDDPPLTVTAILVKVCASALRAFPHFNSSLDLAQGELILKEYVHIGVAVATDNGLLVPVIRDADKKGIETLAAELTALSEKARNRKIALDEMEGGTFTVSNLGGIGGTSFTPIVYPPQVAILGVSRTETVPLWNGKEFAPQSVIPLSLTYDHRVVDGADGARFLRWVCEALENPLRMVMKG